ncbi:MAG: hypothetical protein PVH61_06445 [Candidatus Aminicenantes bacterium]
MTKIKKSEYVVHLVFILTMLFAISLLQGQAHKKIVEKVVVENIEIPVRVFQGTQPVGGLKKEDFRLYVNGKPREINGFYQLRKKLADDSSRDAGSFLGNQPSAPPRLFVLIYNLSAYTQDLTSQLNTLFERIIRPKDRIMVITNNFFITEWEVINEEKAKEKILNVLDKEIRKLKQELIVFENELRSIAAVLKSRLQDSEGIVAQTPTPILYDFFINYQFILEDIKEKYLSIPLDQYIKISEYLKSQEGEKWVINFYQLGRLPLLDDLGEINRIISRLGDDGTSTNSLEGGGETPQEIRQVIQDFYLNFINRVKMIDNLFVDDIGKAFINSGATFHTQLLLPLVRSFSPDFRYQTITTESENILRTLSKLTGGSIFSSNRTEKFIKDITSKEDISYVLTYVPNTGKKRKKPKVNIKVKNNNYRVVFDDQRRLKSFKTMMTRLTQNYKDIEIESLSCNDNLVTFKLKNIEVVQYEGEKFWAVQSRIKILDNHSRLITGFQKVFKGIKGEGEGTIQVKLPSLTGGRYYVVLEVKDLFSLKSVTAGDAISIIRN